MAKDLLRTKRLGLLTTKSLSHRTLSYRTLALVTPLQVEKQSLNSQGLIAWGPRIAVLSEVRRDMRMGGERGRGEAREGASGNFAAGG